jgi:outer membrane protein TolC
MLKSHLRQILFLVLISTSLLAQRIDYNSIILPSDAKEIEFSEKLVQLAWENNPDNQVLHHQVKAAEFGVKIANRTILNQILATGNLNEFNVNPPASAQFPIFYPRYNFGATISLGNLFSDPIKAKRAKEETEIAKQNVNSQKLKLRAEVLRRYQIYLTTSELLKIQTDALEDALASFSLVEQKFKNGSATIAEFNNMLENLNTRKIQKLTSERDFNISKIDIEELIGIKLEDVIRNSN